MPLSESQLLDADRLSRMSIQNVQVFIAQARQEADNPAFKVCGLDQESQQLLSLSQAYFPLYVCIGRKSRSHR
jgi:hypothetical protein